MRLIDIAARAGRGLKNAKGRTILTSLAIAVGAFTLSASLAAGTGARQYADRLIKSNVDPQSVIIGRDKALFGGNGPAGGGLKEYSENSTQLGGATFKALDAKDIDMIKHTKNVESVAPTYLVNVQYITFEGNSTRYVSQVSAYDANVRAETAAGSMPKLGSQLGSHDIVVPESFLSKLGKKPKDMIGKKVTVHVVSASAKPSDAELQQAFLAGGTAAIQQLIEQKSKDVTFTVRAVSANSSTSFSASTALFVSDKSASELSDYVTKGTDAYQKYITASAIVKQGVKPDTVKKELESKGFVVRTSKDLQQLLFTIVGVIQGIVNVFGVLALIASVFGIINTQYISVLERTREIGLMKALGMRGSAVSRLFQFEAAWIGFFGGVLGAGLAVVVGTLLNPWLSDMLSLGDNKILVFEPLPIVGLIIALMLLAMAAGWFPARKAAKLDPIEALRTE